MNNYRLVFFAIIVGLSFAVYGKAVSIGNGATITGKDEGTVISVILSQPNCPLKIEKAAVIRVDGKLRFSYAVKNFGSKSIKGYTIARLYSDNTGGVMTGVLPSGKAELHVNESAALGDEFTEPPKSVGGKNKISKIAFFMIVEILYSDGTSYSDIETFNALEDHLRLFELAYEKIGKK